MSFLSLSMSSFAILRTSSGECVHDGAGCGGVNEAIAESGVPNIDETVENKAECDRCRNE